MHTFARRLHGPASEASHSTTGLTLDQGWRYDLTVALMDTFAFRGQGRALRRRAVALANLQPGERALDVGCGTGTAALDVPRRGAAYGA